MTPLRIKYPVSVGIVYTTMEKDTAGDVLGIKEALRWRGHAVTLMKVDRNNWRKAARLPGDVIINLVEDPSWELFAKVGRLLDISGRAQVGLDASLVGLTRDKARVKRRLVNKGLSTPRYRVISPRPKKVGVKSLEYPLIAKPVGEHASFGISQDSVVIDPEELQGRVDYLRSKFGGGVLVEEYIEGRELHVTVMGNDRHVFVMPCAEIDFRGEYAHNWNVYTFEAKWVVESWEYWNSPTRLATGLSKRTMDRVEKLVVAAFKAFGCRDIVRFDLRLNQRDEPYIIDINVCPSLSGSDNDECWLSARMLGWTYPEFIETLVGMAYKRFYGRMPDRIRSRQFLFPDR